MATNPTKNLELVVPPDVVRCGSGAVREHILGILKNRQTIWDAEQAAKQKRLAAIYVPLTLEHAGEILVGAITLSGGKGWAVLDVVLHQPEIYATTGTLYAEKYSTSSDKNLLTEALEPTGYAVSEAKKLLVRLYEEKRRGEKFAHVYAVCAELKGEI